MLYRHLPEESAEIAWQQDWNDLSLGLQLIGFIQAHVPDWQEKLKEHLAAVQAEENAFSAGLDH